MKKDKSIIEERRLRNIIRSVIREEVGKVIPGDSPGEKQVHIFDFDDTLGETLNTNAIMLYKDGEPVHKSEAEARDWMKQMGLSDKDLLDPKIMPISERDGAYAIYVTSGGLAKVQSKYHKDDQKVTGDSEPDKGEQILIDFTPSSNTNVDTTKPIKQTIEKLKAANADGAKTAIVTARTARGKGTDIHGNSVEATNADDMEKFLTKQGATPTDGVFGVTGGDKGDKIKSHFIDVGDPPEEVHFYDDLSRNTDAVKGAIAQKTDSELFIYGPGEFAHGDADANEPSESFPPAEDKKSTGKTQQNSGRSRGGSQLVERWQRLAGIIK